MTRRQMWLCILGLHRWTQTPGTLSYQQSCAHCGWPRTR